jgi:nucleoside-diphosphate-sugar epimerase
MAMAEDTTSAHRTYFLCAREQMDSEQLWRAMGEAMGRRVRVFRVPRPLLRDTSLLSTAGAKVFGFTNQLDSKQVDQMVAPAFMCSSEALQKAHGWTPRVSLVGSLTKAWTAYRTDGWL